MGTDKPIKKTGNKSTLDIYGIIDGELFGTYKKLAIKLENLDYKDCVRCNTRASYYVLKSMGYFTSHYESRKYIAASKIMTSALFKIYGLTKKFNVSKIHDLWSQVETLVGGRMMGSSEPMSGAFKLRNENTGIYRFMVEPQIGALANNNANSMNITLSTFYSYALPIGIGFYDDYRSFTGENIRRPISKAYSKMGGSALIALKEVLSEQYFDCLNVGIPYFDTVKDKVKEEDETLYEELLSIINGDK